jgi:hypothetical protein
MIWYPNFHTFTSHSLNYPKQIRPSELKCSFKSILSFKFRRPDTLNALHKNLQVYTLSEWYCTFYFLIILCMVLIFLVYFEAINILLSINCHLKCFAFCCHLFQGQVTFCFVSLSYKGHCYFAFCFSFKSL